MHMNSRYNAIILFDGVCNLCNSSVNFIIDRDKAGNFKFSALQSVEARPYLERAGKSPDELDAVLQSLVLIEGENFYTRSTAALRIARRLDGLWPLAYGFIIIPKFIRDKAYDWVARNRYKWFGRLDACRIPTPELRKRFLDQL